MPEPRFRFHLLALLVVAIWGVTFVCTKVLIGAGMAPAAIFFCRFALAYAGIWLYMWFSQPAGNSGRLVQEIIVVYSAADIIAFRGVARQK